MRTLQMTAAEANILTNPLTLGGRDQIDSISRKNQACCNEISNSLYWKPTRLFDQMTP